MTPTKVGQRVRNVYTGAIGTITRVISVNGELSVDITHDDGALFGGAASAFEVIGIDVDNTERGTDLRSPKGKTYTVVDFDSDQQDNYFLWLLADGAKRRIRLYERDSEGWIKV